jgi:hypothetical protein
VLQKFCEDACSGKLKSDTEVGRAICGLPGEAADRLAEERLLARLANPISGVEFLADWRKLVGRTVSLAHCTVHDAQPNIDTVLCAIIEGSTPVADIQVRLSSGTSPPPDCSEPKLTAKCSVIARGIVVVDASGRPGLSKASLTR